MAWGSQSFCSGRRPFYGNTRGYSRSSCLNAPSHSMGQLSTYYERYKSLIRPSGFLARDNRLKYISIQILQVIHRLADCATTLQLPQQRPASTDPQHILTIRLDLSRWQQPCSEQRASSSSNHSSHTAHNTPDILQLRTPARPSARRPTQMKTGPRSQTWLSEDGFRIALLRYAIDHC